MNTIINDLHALTTIDEKRLAHLFKLTAACISEEFSEMILKEETTLEYDISIGILTIGIREGQIKYKFTPNELLANSLVNVMKGKRNLLETKVEKQLVSSIENTYKDLL